MGFKTKGGFNLSGFLVLHKESELPLKKFVVPVDKIEEITAIDFSPKLDDKMENRLEKSSDYKNGSFN